MSASAPVSLTRFSFSTEATSSFTALVASAVPSLKLFMYAENSGSVALSKLVIIPAISDRTVATATSIGSLISVKLAKNDAAVLGQITQFITFRLFFEEWIPFEKQHNLNHGAVISFAAGSTPGSSIVVLMEILMSKVDHGLQVKSIVQVSSSAADSSTVPMDLVYNSNAAVPTSNTSSSTANVIIVGTQKQAPWITGVSSDSKKIVFSNTIAPKLAVAYASSVVWQTMGETVLIGGSEAAAGQPLPQQEYIATVNIMTGVTNVYSLINSSRTSDNIIGMKVHKEQLVVGRNFLEQVEGGAGASLPVASISIALSECTSPWWITPVILLGVVIVGLAIVAFLLVCLVRMFCLRCCNNKYESL